MLLISILCDDIMIDSGMIRDNNLLELFNDIDYDKGI